MDVKKDILFIIPSMSGGGSQKVISLIIKYLDRTKFKPTLILVKKEGIYLKNIPNDVKIIDLNLKRRSYAILKIIIYIYKLKPYIVISTIGSMNILIATIIPILPKNIIYIARESSIVSKSNKLDKYQKILDFMYRKFYNNYSYIISQSKYMKQDLILNYGTNSKKIKLINNPIDIDSIKKLSNINNKIFLYKNRINLLAVGRLDYVKRFDLLLETLFKLDKRFQLTILGEGKEENKLKRLAKTLMIEDRVSFLGFKSNPYVYMKNADLFVLTSEYEGFPNVLLEANSCGLGVVAFNSEGGTSEIIEDGFNGFLVKKGDIEKLKEKIEFAVNFKFDSEKIKNRIYDKYRLKFIMNKYERLFDVF